MKTELNKLPHLESPPSMDENLFVEIIVSEIRLKMMGAIDLIITELSSRLIQFIHEQLYARICLARQDEMHKKGLDVFSQMPK